MARVAQEEMQQAGERLRLFDKGRMRRTSNGVACITQECGIVEVFNIVRRTIGSSAPLIVTNRDGTGRHKAALVRCMPQQTAH